MYDVRSDDNFLEMASFFTFSMLSRSNSAASFISRLWYVDFLWVPQVWMIFKTNKNNWTSFKTIFWKACITWPASSVHSAAQWCLCVVFTLSHSLLHCVKHTSTPKMDQESFGSAFSSCSEDQHFNPTHSSCRWSSIQSVWYCKWWRIIKDHTENPMHSSGQCKFQLL